MKRLAVLLLIALLTLLLGTQVFAEQIYTGLIVDARELGVDPSKSPKIYDATGDEIYGTLNIDPEYVIKVGIVQYERTVYDAIIHETAGNNPIVVRAIRRGSYPYKSDVVISFADGKWILRANERSYFLQLLKVVFVI